MRTGARVRHRVRQRVITGEQIALGAEARLAQPRRVAGQPGIVCRGPQDRGFDAAEGLVRCPAAGEADAYPQARPRGHARRPVPGGDHADVDVVGPGDLAESRVVGAGVHLLLKAGECLEDHGHAVNRIHRAVRRLGMRRDALDLYLDPQDAHTAEQQGQAGRPV